MRKCPDCNGPAALTPYGNGECGECHGTGKIGGMDAVAASFSGSSQDCESCGGSGKCRTCDGEGHI